MVVKPPPIRALARAQFESRVILDGSQTGECGVSMSLWFESRVILDGSQTELV